MKDEYIIHICPKDQLFMVCRKSAGTPHVWWTVAECYTREVAELLYKVLMKKSKKDQEKNKLNKKGKRNE